MLCAQHWIPSANSYYDDYTYDNLNRLKQVTESGNASFVQAFDYDRWGNRTINQTLTTTHTDLNKKLFTVRPTFCWCGSGALCVSATMKEILAKLEAHG
ncbi:MAG: hypothetical protein JST84_33835 [Acidobacteria bacterium]|nr:hypothetical protein [Acidobacteriota bacterium]